MKTLIYQYWAGEDHPGTIASKNSISNYARKMGADYRFDSNDIFVKVGGRVARYFDSLRPVYDESFHDYDRVLFIDSDVFALDSAKENIFDLPVGDVGMCEEAHQPRIRENNDGGISGKNDERWAALATKEWNSHLPRDEQGRLRVFNSGVVLYSGEGMRKCRERFVPPAHYVKRLGRRGFLGRGRFHRLYSTDQHYLHAMVFRDGIDFTVIPPVWNAIIHGHNNSDDVYDGRTDQTKFAHIQLRGADWFDEQTHLRIANLPQSEWKIEQCT